MQDRLAALVMMGPIRVNESDYEISSCCTVVRDVELGDSSLSCA